MKKINIIQLLQKIQSGTQPKTIKAFGRYYDWDGEDYFNKDVKEYIVDSYDDRFYLKDLVNKFCIEIPEPVSLTKAEKKWMEAVIEMNGFSRDVTISKKGFPPFTMAKRARLNQDDKSSWNEDWDSDLTKIVIKCANSYRAAVFDKSHFIGMELDHDYTPDDLGLFNEEDE